MYPEHGGTHPSSGHSPVDEREGEREGEREAEREGEGEGRGGTHASSADSLNTSSVCTAVMSVGWVRIGGAH